MQEAGMSIDSMPAGREMDALVAEKVMGWRLDDDGFWTLIADPMCQASKPKAYSSDIALAWEVVEKMGRPCNLTFHHDGRWAMQFGGSGSGLGDTAPLAISRAALKAVRV